MVEHDEVVREKAVGWALKHKSDTNGFSCGSGPLATANLCYDVIHFLQVTHESPDGARLADFIRRDVSFADVGQGALHVFACGGVEVVAVEVLPQRLVS